MYHTVTKRKCHLVARSHTDVISPSLPESPVRTVDLAAFCVSFSSLRIFLKFPGRLWPHVALVSVDHLSFPVTTAIWFVGFIYGVHIAGQGDFSVRILAMIELQALWIPLWLASVSGQGFQGLV